MEVEDIEKVAVIGAGDMGHGIAELSALTGFDTVMRDIKQEFVDRGLERIEESIGKLAEKEKVSEEDAEKALSRLKGTVDMEEAASDADFVIEAVPEKMDLKKSVFSELDELTPDRAILATNTSNMSISEIGEEATDRPEKVVGMHFFNPVVLMDLVEVIKGNKTDEETMELTYDLARKMGKSPVRVEKDSPGFIVNRINAPASILMGKMLDTGEIEPEEIDAVAKKGGMPMGPFELMDYVGIDVLYHTNKYLEERVSPHYAPSKTIEGMVERGDLGKKTGKGFYDWSKGRPEIDLEKAPKELEFGLEDMAALQANEATKLLEEGVVKDPEIIDEAVKKGGNVPMGPLEAAEMMGYDSLAKKCEELAEEHGMDIFKPTETLKEGGPKRSSKEEERPLELETVKLEKDKENKIARVTLNRPDKINAVSPQMLNDLDKATDDIWDDDNVRVVIVRGAGGNFSSGADLSAVGGSLEDARKGQRVYKKFTDMPKIVLAAIEGYALGGGLELAAACDLRVAKDDASLGFPEAGLGIIPGWGGTQRISKLIGISKAMELCLTTERMSAEDAERFGLVNKVFEEDEFEEEVEKYAKKLVDEVNPNSARIIKRVVNRGGEIPNDIGLELENLGLGSLF